jgi:hypothetical protein
VIDECTALETALARWIKDHTGVECATVTVTRKPPKTREQVLEEALREIPCSERHCIEEQDSHVPGCAKRIARRALQWKP